MDERRCNADGVMRSAPIHPGCSSLSSRLCCALFEIGRTAVQVISRQRMGEAVESLIQNRIKGHPSAGCSARAASVWRRLPQHQQTPVRGRGILSRHGIRLVGETEERSWAIRLEKLRFALGASRSSGLTMPAEMIVRKASSTLKYRAHAPSLRRNKGVPPGSRIRRRWE